MPSGRLCTADCSDVDQAGCGLALGHVIEKYFEEMSGSPTTRLADLARWNEQERDGRARGAYA